MERLHSIAELVALSERLSAARDPDRTVVTLCGGTGCTASGSEGVKAAFLAELRKRRLAGKVDVKMTGCHGFCEQGPVCVIYPKKFFYKQVTPEDVPEIVEKTLRRGEVIERLQWVDPQTGRRITYDDEVPFYAKQRRVVLAQNGWIDPTDPLDYLADGGYRSLARVLSEMTPEQVIDEVERSGLRGRGGAGFPTGRKWRFARGSAGDKKYIVCNADEGDPGAFMDRSVLEGNTHLVVEGMLIAAYAIGADEGYVYVRAEYPMAVRNLRKAIADGEALGLLGKDILGTGFSFDLHVKEGAGAFVCGEETALLASIEGRRGTPRPRPPFPAVSGLWGKPTNINNVETYANVPIILRLGAEEYARTGTEKSKGTKIFSLTGKVNNTGLVEVPIGTSLREVIFDIGGGIPRGRKVKAAQMGGPSGGCIPARHLDLPIDYESLTQVGSMMGSGGLIVMDEATCMVDTARFFLTFTQSESCGKCTPCRAGTRRMLEILTRICEGNGRMEDLDRLEYLGRHIKETSLCGLGQTAPNPVLSTLRYFRDEYEAHIREKRCPAGVCEKLTKAPCVSACPLHVDAAGYVQLIAAGREEDAVHLERLRNPLISVCGRVCHHPCEGRCRRGEVDEAISIMHLKRYLAEQARARRIAPRIRTGKPTGKKVAVIGSGPAGLNAAYHLARRGHRVVIFEGLKKPGGMLRVAIPEYRLPRAALDFDLEFILAHGVDLRTGKPVGANGTSLSGLLSSGEFGAVFAAPGAHVGMKLAIPGEDARGVYDGLAFLRALNVGRPPKVKGRVLVVGGGNVAMDAARSALRLGASEVVVLYRRTREEMPAAVEEIREAQEEGVLFKYLVGPVRVEANGRVRGLACVRMELGPFDESGRRRPVVLAGSEYVEPADLVVAAIGQTHDPAWMGKEGERIVDRRGLIVADPFTLATALPGLFAGGDAVTGPWTVTDAMAHGERAAVSIDMFLRGLDPALGRLAEKEPAFDVPIVRLDDLAECARCRPAHLAPRTRVRGFAEVVKAFPVKTARFEGNRCLRCDQPQG